MKLNLGPEFLKYLAAHASVSGKHLPTLEKLAQRNSIVMPVNRRSYLKPSYTAVFVEIRRGKRI
jgi:hypothetical protein